MVKLFLYFLTLLAVTFSWHAQAFLSVTATVDKNPVMVNESFMLKVTADDDINRSALDTSVLLKDFIVGRTSVSSQTSMVNFKTTRTTTWSTVLIARQTGDFIIPALTVEQSSTQPIQIEVVAATDPQLSQQQDIFISTEISSQELYVQQQVSLVVKLHFAAELKRGSLTEPSLADANIKQIGKDAESDTIVNGRRYRVIERTYTISPQKSGTFTLNSPVFNGEIMVQSRRRSNFLSFADTKPISVIADDITLTVKPMPDDYQGAWLPSELLVLDQEWQPSIDTFTVGEPITRIITLTAAGLSEEQLPDLPMPVPAGVKVYPDQAQLHTGINQGRLVSQKVYKFALVASKAGDFELPEIIIPWWNTVTNRYEQATIAAQTITVLPGQAEVAAEVLSQQDAASAPQIVYVPQSSWLQWLFLGLWLFTCCAWLTSYLWQKQSAKAANKRGATSANDLSSKGSVSRAVNVKDPYLALLAACKQSNGQQAIELIVPWFNQTAAMQCATIAEVCAQLENTAFNTAIDELQRSLFAKTTQAWQGQALFASIQQINKQTKQAASQPILSLNP